MKKLKIAGNNTATNVVIGIFVGLATVIVGALVGTYLIGEEIADIRSVNYITAATLLCAAFLAAAVGGKGTAGKARLITSGLTGGGFWLILLCINLLMFGDGISGAWVTAVLILASCAASFLLFGKSGSKKKYRIPKY